MYRILRLERKNNISPSDSDCGEYYLFGDVFKTEKEAKKALEELLYQGQGNRRFKIIQEIPTTISFSVN